MRTLCEHQGVHHRGFRLVGWAVFGVMAAGFFALVFAVFVKLLWNWLMPGLFGLAAVSFWQAFGLVLLARLLVGGWRHGSHHPDRWIRKTKPAAGDLPREIRENLEAHRGYWEEEGKAAFESYLQRKGREAGESK